MRTVFNMDLAWQFHRGDLPEDMAVINSHAASYASCKAGEGASGAKKEYADREWRCVDLPHDYLSESEVGAENLLSHGYRVRDNAWYRKSFILDETLKDKALTLCFEGTAVNAEFYFNGSLMARSFSAYTETFFDITDRAYFDGRPNVLAVRILGFATEGWWYEGSGIYRHVKLYATEKLHIAHNGIFAKPVLKKGTKNSWNVEIETTLENRDYETCGGVVRATLFDGETVVSQGASSEVSVDGFTQRVAKFKIPVSRPTRWDVDNPKLYNLQIELMKDGTVIDSDTVRIGFRTFYADAEKGFFLNGRPLKIKGTCNHQDHAGVGVAVPDTLQYYRIGRLKEMGTNAYRCSHNLPAKEILDACDELGLIVMDENRRFESREEVLEYLRVMVKRDRNHPSVMFYSLFNEEPLQNTEEGARMFRHMRKIVEQLDDTRLITGCINSNTISHDGAGEYMDVIGINYAVSSIDKNHQSHKGKPIIGSENNSAITTRGCYCSDREGKQVLSQYDGAEVVSWGQSIGRTWDFTRKNDYHLGIFIWTGFDYRGEPTPFKWPSVSSQFGIMDTCGFAKESFYYNKACFTAEPMVHLMPHWNWKKGDNVKVVAITNCDEAELFLNGVSLGKKMADVCAQPEWDVDYVAGCIEAKAYKEGKCVACDVRHTTGEPKAVKLESYRDYVTDGGQDVVILNCSVVDENGQEVATAENHLNFEIVGDGVLLGVGNGNPNSHESDVLPERDLFAGHCQAIIRALPKAETFKIRVSGEGLKPAEFEPRIIKVNPPLYMESVVSANLGGITRSAVAEKRPDPLIKLADYDQNTFIPLEAAGSNGYMREFVNGWCTLRVCPTIPLHNEQKGVVLTLPEVRTDEIEIYVDGKLLFECHTRMDNQPVSCTFKAHAGEKSDIRILMRAWDNGYFCGIKNNIIRLEENG